ncbi:MAG: hypothetical protein FJ098_05495 [Deltaproteobacteria bacterium]|nr:hypothetical protein [Deltaproteobacteria bacterium]
MPIRTLARGMDERLLKIGTALFGKLLIRSVPFEELYFLPEARVVRQAVALPLVYVGGLLSRRSMETALGEGFDVVQLARALITEPDLLERLRTGVCEGSRCRTTNECLAVMYSGPARCGQPDRDPVPPR